jgi:hypothetical protein
LLLPLLLPLFWLFPRSRPPLPLLLSNCPGVGSLLESGVGIGPDEIDDSVPEDKDTFGGSISGLSPDKFDGPATSLCVIKGMNAVTVGFACCWR